MRCICASVGGGVGTTGAASSPHSRNMNGKGPAPPQPGVPCLSVSCASGWRPPSSRNPVDSWKGVSRNCPVVHKRVEDDARERKVGVAARRGRYCSVRMPLTTDMCACGASLHPCCRSGIKSIDCCRKPQATSGWTQKRDDDRCLLQENPQTKPRSHFLSRGDRRRLRKQNAAVSREGNVHHILSPNHMLSQRLPSRPGTWESIWLPVFSRLGHHRIISCSAPERTASHHIVCLARPGMTLTYLGLPRADLLLCVLSCAPQPPQARHSFTGTAVPRRGQPRPCPRPSPPLSSYILLLPDDPHTRSLPPPPTPTPTSRPLRRPCRLPFMAAALPTLSSHD